MVVVLAVVDLIEPFDGTVAIDGLEEDHVIAEAVIPTRVIVASMSAPFIWVPTKAVVLGGLMMISVGEFTRIELVAVLEPFCVVTVTVAGPGEIAVTRPL